MLPAEIGDDAKREGEVPPLDDEQKRRVEAAVKERFPDPGPCPICRKDEWHVVPDGFVIVPFQQDIERDPDGDASLGVLQASQMMPSVAVLCVTCGNTLLLNAYVLGLGDLIGPSLTEQRRRAEASAEAKDEHVADAAPPAAEADR
jgi:hypothetical protein